MTKFSDLKLDPKVLAAVADAGYETPTPIQIGAIPPALEGRDVLGIAQTGTGKTAGFVLPMITLLGRGRARARMPRSLVLCPTRELAAQVAENFDIYAKNTRLTKALLIGGVSFGEQDKLIDRGVDVLIATPGRLLDHFERGKLLLTGVQIMVVDEADRMLDMGFIPDIERIFQLTPFTRQTLFFSATMAPEIERITNTFLNAPERIEVARQATTGENITQKLIELAPTRKDQAAKQKRELLRALIDAEGEPLKNAIIFCNRKTDVDIVAKSLKAHGYDAAPIHGDLDQRVRMATLDGFRDGSLRFLVASDVAARGLDIPAVSHVFNFDLPSHAEDYVHRIGRTGRAGRQGTAISISTPADDKYLSAIENLVKQPLPRAEIPEGFRLSDAAQRPPRPAAERGVPRGAPARSRSRRSGPKEPTAPEVTEAAAPVPEAPREAPRAPQPERNGESRSERSSDSRRSNGNGHGNGHPNGGDHRQAGGDDHRRDRGSDDRRYRDRDRGPAVAGMGEHVPDFMRTSFTEALSITDARMASRSQSEQAGDDETPVAVPATAPVTAEATGGSGSGRSRSRSRSRSGTKDRAGEQAAADAMAEQPPAEDATETAVADVAAEVVAPAPETAPVDIASAEVAADTVSAPPAPAPADAGTSDTVPVEAPAEEAAPPVEAAEVAEKPKRTRRTTTAKPAAKTAAKTPAKTAKAAKPAAKAPAETAAGAAEPAAAEAGEAPAKPAAKPRTRKAPAKTAAKPATRSTAKKSAADPEAAAADTAADTASDAAQPTNGQEDAGPTQG